MVAISDAEDDDRAQWGDVVAEFFRVAASQPHRSAVVHNGSEITYGELAGRVRRRGTGLRVRPHGPEGASGRIGVLVSHQPAAVEHLLGILDAGACYCPIDATLPAARKQALAEAVGVDQVLSLNLPAPEAGIPGEVAVDDPGAAADGPDSSPAGDFAPGAPAYILCTSGSTGVPKPVVVSRGALGITIAALRDLFRLTPEDRVLQFASLAWDTCLEEMLPTLTSGAALVFDDAAYSGSLPAFVRMLAERGITMVDLPTAFWHELVLFLHEEKLVLPANVRLVVIGGERVDPTRLKQWRDLGNREARLLNTYGCTETTLITHAVQLDGPGTDEAIAEGSEAPLGYCLPHAIDYVADSGELLVAGRGIASRYLGMPDATDKAFPVEDHGSGPIRWFHTGDIVTLGPSGALLSQGRADEQLKVLGVRVHPAEVETQLTSHPAVTGAVVIGEKMLARTVLVAYVVCTREVSCADLKGYLRERLPNQFVPNRIAFVDALSYTDSGKVDRAGTQRAAKECAAQAKESIR